MKKTIMTLCLVTGLFSLTNANYLDSNHLNSKHLNSKHKKAKRFFDCTLDATCSDGSHISVSATNCETAGRKVDAACAS